MLGRAMQSLHVPESLVVLRHVSDGLGEAGTAWRGWCGKQRSGPDGVVRQDKLVMAWRGLARKGEAGGAR